MSIVRREGAGWIATDIEADRACLARWRYGAIDVSDGKLVCVRRRLWPKSVSLVGVWLGRLVGHGWIAGDFCRLYYNQPARSPRYLTLRFVISRRQTSLRSFRGALRILDEIARIKGADAIVCEVVNGRISHRLLSRWGWERHVTTSRRRHYIKRFYGHFPPEPLPAELCRAEQKPRQGVGAETRQAGEVEVISTGPATGPATNVRGHDLSDG